jgi:hypothetical protein
MASRESRMESTIVLGVAEGRVTKEQVAAFLEQHAA